MENKAFKIAGIKNLLKTNYKIPTDLIDVKALVDDSLSMSENWFNNIKPKVKLLKNEKY
jgi:hypothetical protein